MNYKKPLLLDYLVTIKTNYSATNTSRREDHHHPQVAGGSSSHKKTLTVSPQRNSNKNEQKLSKVTHT